MNKIHDNLPICLTDLALLTGLLIAYFAFFLGSAPLAIPDGARYAEIAREMVAHQQYLVPHLNGAIYFEKPPLFYWMQALAIHWFGLSEWALRFWQATLGILGCLLNYIVAYQLYNRRTAWLASLILASSLLYFALAHLISLDLALGFYLNLSLYCFLLWTEKQTKTFLLYFAYIAMAAAIMTKGFVAFVFPTLIIGLWIIFSNHWQLIRRMQLIRGLLLVLVLITPWHAYMQWHYPFFFKFYFLDQQFLRFSTNISDRTQPIWFFAVVTLIGFFPWWLNLFSCIKQTRLSWPQLNLNERNRLRFLWIWVLSIFLFFSLSHSKLIPYILPMFMPLSLLLASHLNRQWPIARRRTWFCGCVAGALCLGLVLARPIIETRTIKPLAIYLKQHDDLNKVTPVSFNRYYQDMPFYLQQEVLVVRSLNEFELAAKHQDISQHFISSKDFWQRWKSPEQMVMIADFNEIVKLRKIHPNYTFKQVAKHKSDVLITNHP